MSVSLKESFDIAYDGSENAARMDLYIDDVSDLSSLTHFDSIKILQGSTAKDISTGDLYQMQTNGTWVLQPSSNLFANVYTKAEIDTMVNTIYQIMMYYHTVLESDDGTITFYAFAGVVGSLTIYGNAQQGDTPEFVGVRTPNLADAHTITATWATADNELLAILNTLVQGNYVLSYDITLTSRNNINDSSTYGVVIAGIISDYLKSWGTSPVGTTRRVNHSIIIGDSAGHISNMWFYGCGINGVGSTGSANISNIMINTGSTALPYEPYGYKIPITCAGQTTPIYIGDPLRKALDGSEAVDVLSSAGTIIREVDADGNELVPHTTQIVDVPEISIDDGENTLTVDTVLPPSRITITGE